MVDLVCLPFSEKQDDRYLKWKAEQSLIFIRDVAQSIKNTIEESPFSVEELDYLLCTVNNIRIFDKMVKRFEFLKNYLIRMEYGGFSAASIPILLSEVSNRT